MTWARLDDGFHRHPKRMQLKLAPLGLFAVALSYAADNSTNGNVPGRWVAWQIHDDDADAPAALVRAGLWVPDGEGNFAIHDYYDYNLTPQQLTERRDRDRDRKRKQRGREAASRRDTAPRQGTGTGEGKYRKLAGR